MKYKCTKRGNLGSFEQNINSILDFQEEAINNMQLKGMLCEKICTIIQFCTSKSNF